MVRLACLAAVLAAVLAPAAQAAGLPATVKALDRQMNRAGSGSGAYVIDLDTGATLYSRAPDVARIPASVNKLYTTSAALVRYGNEGQLTTEALGDAQPDDDGVIKGNLYLHGGGDPEFGRAEARGLAQVLATSGLTRVTRRVIGDESRFDRLRGGPDSNYGVSEWVGPLSALLVQPRVHRRHAAALPEEPGLLRRPPVRARAAAGGREDQLARPRRRRPGRPPRRSANGRRRACRC